MSEPKKRTYIGFYADEDVVKIIKAKNDQIYQKTGRSNQSQAVNELIRKGEKKDADHA